MPYCPKCDMEFIDGITVCTDCGGPLLESKEAAQALKEKELQAEKERRASELESMKNSGFMPNPEDFQEFKKRAGGLSSHSSLYVDKSQKYQEHKASASALIGVGTVLTAVSLLLWSGIVQLPFLGTSSVLTFGVLTVMGVGLLAAGIFTLKSAKVLSVQAKDEEKATASILAEFLKNHTADSLDKTLGRELDGLSAEEITLKRMDLIQDILITENDIPQQAYADSLADQLYEQIYENNQ